MAAPLRERLKYLFTGEKSEGASKALSGVNSGRGWIPIVWESFAGAWQRNVVLDRDTLLSFHAVFSCVTLIASDISKMRLMVTAKSSAGIWEEVKGESTYDELMKNPNGFQNLQQFLENWLVSKLTRGNAYILKRRGRKGKVTSLVVLNPDLVQVLVSDSGEVFYQLQQDNLAGQKQPGLIIPASEIIHDRFNCLFHPLVGLPPIFASNLAASQGIKIQTNSAKFFENMSRPSGILVAPGAIDKDDAMRIKENWDANFTEGNLGKTAVMGDGMKYEPMTLTAEESEMVEQLKLTSDIVCSTFHVPKYMVMGEPPTYNNIEALSQQYYSQCLQTLIEAVENCLDEGLGVPANRWLTFDLDTLIRMDSKTQIDTLTEGVKGKVLTPNEARKKLNLKPLEGGDKVYLQQQDFPMDVLAGRKNPDDKPAPAAPSPTPAPPAGEEGKGFDEILECIKKEIAHEARAVC